MGSLDVIFEASSSAAGSEVPRRFPLRANAEWISKLVVTFERNAACLAAALAKAGVAASLRHRSPKTGGS